MLHSHINNVGKIELKLYYFIWIFAVFYSIYNFTINCNKQFQNFNDEYGDFSEGWISNRKKDVADDEWQTIIFLLENIYPWMFLWLVVSEVLRKFNLIRILPYWEISLTICFITTELGIYAALAILFQPIVFMLVVSVVNNAILVWICNGLLLILMTFYKTWNVDEQFLISINQNIRQSYLTVAAVFWMNLKCVSYSLDAIQDANVERNLFDFLSYCLYFPTIFSGPFIRYKHFKNCHKPQNDFKKRTLMLILNILRFLFWVTFTEFVLHYIYVNASSFQSQWVETLHPWSLYGYGYLMGQFFHIKYIVWYGLSTSLAKFEGIPVPSLPKCIGRIHLYSDMWKYFDAGLYNFLIRYIYVPAVTSKIIKSRSFASLLCFTFVYAWHGTDTYIFVWTSLNYIGILIENGSESIYKSYLQRSKFLNTLGNKCFRRICCILASPLLALSATSNMYFFARMDIGNIFFYRILKDGLLTNMVLIFVLYCCCQISTQLRPRLQKRHTE